MNQVASKLSLQEFLALPQSSDRYELVGGQLKQKMSPKYKHASSQGRLFRLLDEWCDLCGSGRNGTKKSGNPSPVKITAFNE